MTARAATLQPGEWQKTNIDLGALNQRVTGLEAQIAGIGEKIDKLGTKPTNWFQFIGAAGVVLTIVGGFMLFGWNTITTGQAALGQRIQLEEDQRKKDGDKFEQTLAPIAAVAAQHTSDLSAAASQQADNLRQFKAIDVALEMKWSKDAQTEYEKRMDQVVALEHEYDQRDFDRLLGRVNTLDAELIKRPEIEAIDNGLRNQIVTVETALENFRREIGSAYTWGDELKSLHNQVETLSGRIFSSLAAPAVAPIAPIAPLAPVVPAK